MIKCMIYALLGLVFANLAGTGRINPWWGTFAMIVFLREMWRGINDIPVDMPRQESEEK